MESRCSICGRKLTNPESVARGIGPVCYKKVKLKSHERESIDSCGEKQQTLTHYM